VRYLSLAEVLLLHRIVMEQGRQQPLLRDLGALESAIAQPRQSFGAEELYPSIAAKAAALGFALIQNHPFVDGNKRVGHAAMVVFLRLNGRRLEATVDEAEQAILQVASGTLDRARLQDWVAAHEALS
jgi:death-on-curing protein